MKGVSYRWTHGAVVEALAPVLEAVSEADPTAVTEEDAPYAGVSTDTRRLEGGELFVALVGERFDAHDFVERAVAAGAAGVVVSRELPRHAGVPLYRVSDTLEGLGLLARYVRRKHPGTVVGITGSLGKTTVKELLRAAVAQDRSVYANPGNWNNRVGLPLSLLQAPMDAPVLLLEMGTNEPGEIAALTAIAEPDLAVVTTVAEVHLEKLGSREGVLREKLALVEGLGPHGQAVVGDDPPELADAARRRVDRVHVAGMGADADPELTPRESRLGPDGAYRFSWRGRSVELQIPGRPAVANALLALAAARCLGIPDAAAVRGVGSVRAPEMRGEVRHLGAMTVLVDCYNASPGSVVAAVETLRAFPGGGRRVAVLGSMLELGERQEELHRDVLDRVAGEGVDLLVTTGAFADAAEAWEGDASPRVLRLPDPVEGWDVLADALGPDDRVLLKASRGERLERLLPLLEERFGEPDTGSDPSPGSGETPPPGGEA